MRVSVICALFAFLLVATNAAPRRQAGKMFSWGKQLSATNAASCLNSCNNQGQCITSPSSQTGSCLCDFPYLGVDCSLKGSMNPLIYLNSTLGVYWTFNASDIVVRIAGVTDAAGWVGLMWGSTDGMTNGQSNIVSVTNTINIKVEEMYSAKKGKPSVLPDQSINSTVIGGASGFDSAGYPFIDVTFARALVTGLNRHYPIPAKPGTTTVMSVAMSSKYFEFHSKNATFDKVDIAQLAGVTQLKHMHE